MLLAMNPVARPTTPLRTLVVEDDASSRNALQAILRILGHQVSTATTVGEALHLLGARAEELPETLLLDLMLPDGNGMEVLRQIRKRDLAIRVAVLSGADKPMLEAARALHPDAVFAKPVDAPRLLAWLHTER